MRSAADLTDEMNREEYTEYYKFKTKKFIGKSRHTHFCLWMDWNTSYPTDDVFIIIGWLSVTKIRNILKKALKKRYLEPCYNALFSPPLIQLDKNIPLLLKYFMNNAKYAKYGDTHLETELNVVYNEINDKFSSVRKQRTDLFPLIEQIREKRLLKKKEDEYKSQQLRLYRQKQLQQHRHRQQQLQQQQIYLQQQRLQQQTIGQQVKRQHVDYPVSNLPQSLDDEVLQLLNKFNR